MLRLAGAVHNATHYRELHLFHSWILLLPRRHAGAQIALDLLGHFLEKSGSCSSAARTGRNLRSEAADAERLQDLLRDQNLLCAISVRRRCKRHTNSVTDPLHE